MNFAIFAYKLFFLMSLFRISIYCFFTLLNFSVFSQKKVLLAKLKSGTISIDGKINEEQWLENTEIASDFIMFTPDNGKKIDEDKKRTSRYFMTMMRFIFQLI